jgi:hypothetical protein
MHFLAKKMQSHFDAGIESSPSTSLPPSLFLYQLDPAVSPPSQRLHHCNSQRDYNDAMMIVPDTTHYENSACNR